MSPIWAIVFAGAGSTVVTAIVGRRPLREWRDKRKANRIASLAVLTSAVADLQAKYTEVDIALRKVIVFIEGSPDPFRRNLDGSPVVTGGLLEFMGRVEQLLKPHEAPHQ